MESCTKSLKTLREDDILVVWKLDRLGRNLKHLINTIDDLNKRNIGFKVLSGRRSKYEKSRYKCKRALHGAWDHKTNTL